MIINLTAQITYPINMPRHKKEVNGIIQLMIFLLFIFISERAFAGIKPDLKFKHVTKEQGLSNSTIDGIIQDHQGFMWFGSFDGLNKYDGYQITVYRADGKKNSLNSNYIKQILEDQDHELWFVTGDGLNRYDRATDNFISFKNSKGALKNLNSSDITYIYQDKSGNFWVGTTRGINLVNFKKETFYHCKPISDAVTAIFEDHLGNFWIGTNKGLYLFDRKHQVFTHFQSSARDKATISDNEISCINEDAAGALWIGTANGGLNLMDRTNHRFLRFKHDDNNLYSLSSNVVKCMLSDRAGNFWIGTENGGLNLWDSKDHLFFHYENNRSDPTSLSQKTASAIFEDNQGILWIGTHRGGVDFYSPKLYKFALYTQGQSENTLSYKDVRAFHEDSVIWIGTDGGGINLWDRKKNIFYHYRHDLNNPNSIGSDAVVDIMKDQQGRIWVGTWGGGLNLYNAKERTFTRFLHNPNDKNSISANNVSKTYQDKTGRFWVATTYGGLETFDPVTQKFSPVSYSPSGKTEFIGNRVSDLIEDKSNNIWIGTEDAGLSCFNQATREFKRFYFDDKKSPPSLNANIQCIFCDSKNRVWVGQNGLFKLDGKTTRFLPVPKFKDETIKAIIEDNQGNLWISTTNGLFKFNPEANLIKRFTDADGLQGLEFGGRSCMKTRTGELFFGGFNGFNIFNPSLIQANTIRPPVYFTNFQIFNKNIKPEDENSPLSEVIGETKEITLNYDQSFFSFEFAALNYISPEKSQYAYMMERFDKNWNYVGNQRKATYTNLDPGTYVFHVKASNNDGAWNDTGRSIKITITPPFWMRLWFKLMIAIILFVIVFIGLYFQRRMEIRKLEEKKKEEINQFQFQLFTNISHEFRTPLTLILGTLEQLNKQDVNAAFHHYYEVIQRNANRLTAMISELMDFRKVESGNLRLRTMPGNINLLLNEIVSDFENIAAEKRIRLKIEPRENVFDIWFDRQVVERIALNLINNAIKYTNTGGIITIKMIDTLADNNLAMQNSLSINSPYKAKNYIYISIADNGIGIAEQAMHHLFEQYYRLTSANSGSGVGLAFVKSLVFLHKGNIQVYSEPNIGTEVIVGLPTDKEDYQHNERWVERDQDQGVGLENSHFRRNDLTDITVNKLSDQREFLNHRLNILIVDDNAELRDFLKHSLEMHYQIHEAEDGQQGLSKVKDISPDLVISDVMMPVMDGITFCRELKKDIEISHIPFLLLTAKDAMESKLKGVDSGADFYFAKPLSIELLLLTLRNIFDQRQKLKERYQKDYQVEARELVHSAKDKQFMDHLLKLIASEMENPELNVDYICQQIGMSKTNVYKKIKDITGQTINEFVRTTRLKTAVSIMVNEDVLITEVMYRVGILSHSYFTRAFKKEFGKTPSQFQNALNDSLQKVKEK